MVGTDGISLGIGSDDTRGTTGDACIDDHVASALNGIHMIGRDSYLGKTITVGDRSKKSFLDYELPEG